MELLKDSLDPYYSVFLINAVMYFVTLTIFCDNKRVGAKNMAVFKK